MAKSLMFGSREPHLITWQTLNVNMALGFLELLLNFVAQLKIWVHVIHAATIFDLNVLRHFYNSQPG